MGNRPRLKKILSILGVALFFIQTAYGLDKSPADMAGKLSSGSPSGIIVLFDDSGTRAEVETRRGPGAAGREGGESAAFSAGRLKALKQEVISQLAPGEFETLKDYSHLPMMFVRVRSLNAFIRLLEHPKVLKVYPDEAHIPFLYESLPLIGQPAAAASGGTGAGTTVTVLDSGVDYTLPDFGSCSAPGAPSGCRIVFAGDFATDDGALDSTGHGTNVAGIVAGVAAEADIASLDVFRPDGHAYTSDIIDAVNWCIANQAAYNIVAINLSLGGGTKYTSPCSESVFEIPVRDARSAGIITAIAAGNYGWTDGLSSPACVPSAVSVGSVYDSDIGPFDCNQNTRADKVACFSNSAPFLTILAPGAIIDAAGYERAGTSQASPFIAGAVAVLRGDATFEDYTADEIVSRITGSGVVIADARNGIKKPRLDIDAAVNSIYAIGGRGVAPDGSPLSDVKVILTSSSTAAHVGTTSTGVKGYYSFGGLKNGDYTVTPDKTGYTFVPLKRSISIRDADVPGQFFKGYRNYYISGRVRAADGSGMAGVAVFLTAAGGAVNKKAFTNAGGYYFFEGLQDGSYTIKPKKAGYTFTPSSKTALISGSNVTGLRFKGLIQLAGIPFCRACTYKEKDF